MDAWAASWMLSARSPWLFATAVLGYLPAGAPNPDGRRQLEVWQDEFLRNFYRAPDNTPTTNPRHSVRSGHGIGKTTVIAILAIWFPLTHYDSKTVVSANTQDQLKYNNWSEIRKQAGYLPEPLREQFVIDEEIAYVKSCKEMSFVQRRTASPSNPEALAGVHAKHVLYLVDEASGIAQTIFDTAVGSLSTEGACACLFSNPTKRVGFFHTTHTRTNHRWRCMTVSSASVPRAMGHIADIVETYGETSNQYRVRVLGEFPMQDDDTVIPFELVTEAVGRDVETRPVHAVWGVDIGRFGDDNSVLVKRQGNDLSEKPTIWKNLDGFEVAQRILQIYYATPKKLRPRAIFVDEPGVGASPIDALLRTPIAKLIVAVNTGRTVGGTSPYVRIRDMIWFNARKWFDARDCKIPSHCDSLITELTVPTYELGLHGKLVVEPKKFTKERLLRSPDEADAFCLTFVEPDVYLDSPVHAVASKHRRKHQPNVSAWGV